MTVDPHILPPHMADIDFAASIPGELIKRKSTPYEAPILSMLDRGLAAVL